MSNFTFAANLTIFGQELTITPNTQAPSRIEYHFPRDNEYDLVGFNVLKAIKENADKLNLDSLKDIIGDDINAFTGELLLQDAVINIDTKSFELGIAFKFEDDMGNTDFILNKYPNIISINWVKVYIKVEKGEKEPPTTLLTTESKTQLKNKK